LGGVNNWEPGIGGLGVHYELFEQLTRIPLAVGVAKTTHHYRPEEPYGLSRVDPESTYEQSLRRSGTARDLWRRVHFEPDHLAAVMLNLLEAVGVEVRFHTRLGAVSVHGRQVMAVTLQAADGTSESVYSHYFIDSSGTNVLARAAECQMAFGEEGYAAYQEPSAPDEPSSTVNGVSQIFRVTPTADGHIDPLPALALADDAQAWLAGNHPATFITEYPNGDLALNVLPSMQGDEFYSRSYAESQAKATARMHAHWHRLQTDYGFSGYRLLSMFPLVGVRESHRLVGRQVLIEQDVRAGVADQRLHERLIAFADHPIDTHGRTNVKGPRLPELERPYGIPYDCLLPLEYDNLLVASHGASFSHIASASCRLSRTMIALGEAAGTAGGVALQTGSSFADVPLERVQAHMKIPQMLEKIAREWDLVNPTPAE